MLSKILRLFVLLLAHTVLVSCRRIEDITEPLKKQIFEQVEFPSVGWGALSVEEEKECREVYDNVILEKPEEYNLIIREFEELLESHNLELMELEAVFKKLLNSIDVLQVLSREDQIQRILGGKGIIEFSKLNNNLDFGKNLFGKDLQVGKGIVENFPREIASNLRQPIENLVGRITSLGSEVEKCFRAYQLLNVYRERSHQVYNSEEVISKNNVAVGVLMSGWTYVLGEIETLIKDRLKPLIDEKKDTTVSGDDILKNLELVNSILVNMILLKYGREEAGSEQVVQNGEREGLIKELRIKALNMEEIGVTDRQIKWRLEVVPSILNIFRGPLSKLLAEINKDLENVVLVDLVARVGERIQETNQILSELDQIGSKMESLWLGLKYLSKDQVLVKNNERIKQITNYEDVYNENRQKILFMYEHANAEITQIDEIARNFTLSENQQLYFGLNTLKCLAEYYQVFKQGDENTLFTYSKVNQRCVGFFLDRVESFRLREGEALTHPNEANSPVSWSEEVISHLISIIFPNSEQKGREGSSLNSPISELIQEMESSYSRVESNEAENLELRRANDRSRTVLEGVAKYNDFAADIEKMLNGVEKTSSVKSFEMVRQYVEDLTTMFEDHIKESIGSGDDAVVLFDYLLKELIVMLEEFSEKELNNDYLRVSVSKRFEDVKFLLNDLIANVNLEFRRSSRIESKEFIENARTSLEEVDAEIKLFREELSQVNGFMYKQHSASIASLAAFVYTSRLMLSPIVDLGDRSRQAEESLSDQFTHSFRDKYRYILQKLGHYYKAYQDFKLKKKLLLERENQISSKLSGLESGLVQRSRESVTDSSLVYKIQRQRKIAERILSGYLLQTITLFHSRSEDIKKVVFALDNVISEYDHQISVFKRQNRLDEKLRFKSMIKNILRSRKYFKLRKYHKRMNKFRDYLMLKREQILEFLRFSESALDGLNADLVKLVDHFLCKGKGGGGLESDQAAERPIQIIMGDLYNVFSRIGRLEQYHSPRYIMSISKLLGEISRKYRDISQDINRLQRKARRIFISQQKSIDNAYRLIKITIPAAYIIRKYNKFPREYQRYVFKAGRLDIIGEEPKYINVRGWNLKKGRKSLALENELSIERRYIKSKEELYEVKREVESRLREYSLLPPEKTVDRFDTKTLFFFVPDDLVDQMVFEMEKNHIALRQGVYEKEEERGGQMKTVMSDHVHKLLKRRKSIYNHLSSKSFVTKQAQCSTVREEEGV